MRSDIEDLKVAGAVIHYNSLATVFWVCAFCCVCNFVLLEYDEVPVNVLTILKFFHIVVIIEVNSCEKHILQVNAQCEF